ncbi:MAG: hypothetical protein AAB336_00480 [Acidobacteriota bacterium]
MVLKGYIALWILGIVAAAIVYLTGNLTPVWKVMFGFFTFGAIFMGFLSVIPSTVFHGEPKKH